VKVGAAAVAAEAHAADVRAASTTAIEATLIRTRLRTTLPLDTPSTLPHPVPSCASCAYTGGVVAVAIARELAAYCWEIATCPITAPEPTPTPTTRTRLTNSR
jgi:hypothetical protein